MVFVLDRHKKPLMPCPPRRARLLLARRRAVAHRIRPFVIRLRDRRTQDSVLQESVLKIDPGSRTSGMTLVRAEETPAGEVHHALFCSEVQQRGELVHRGKQTQSNARRRRRSATLRHRAPRFDNRAVAKGWLPPSMCSRVGNILTWARRYSRWVPVGTWTGGRTRWNRARLGIAKTHANDALCVGEIAGVKLLRLKTLRIKATGRGEHCRTNWTAEGFPRGYKMRQKQVRGFKTGDLVRAEVPEPLTTAGIHLGRVAVRASGSFRVGKVDGIHARYGVLVQRADGYEYEWAEQQNRRLFPTPAPRKGTPASSPSLKRGASAGGDW